MRLDTLFAGAAVITKCGGRLFGATFQMKSDGTVTSGSHRAALVTRSVGRVGPVLALAMIAGGLASSAHATQIVLSVQDSYPPNQGSEVDYDSLSGLFKNQVAPADTLQMSTPGMPAGLTSASLTLSNAQGNYALASASLSQGEVKGRADGGLGLVGVISRLSTSNSTMHDGLTFHISDGAADALVGVHVHLDGTEAGAGLGVGGYTNELQFSLGESVDYFAEIVNNGNHGFGFNGVSGSNPISGWDSYTISNASLTGFDFDGVIRVTNGQRQTVNMGLALNCYDNTTCDFSHTGRVSLSLPTDVSFTSDSGVFLSGPPSAGVAEPASWAIMITGFAPAGAGLRRRRPVVVG